VLVDTWPFSLVQVGLSVKFMSLAVMEYSPGNGCVRDVEW